MWSFTHLHMLYLHKTYRAIYPLYISVVAIDRFIFLKLIPCTCVQVHGYTCTHSKGAIAMQTLSIIGLVVIALILLNVISLHAVGTLSLIIVPLIAIIIGAYFLYYIFLSFLALFTTIVGTIMVIKTILRCKKLLSEAYSVGGGEEIEFIRNGHIYMYFAITSPYKETRYYRIDDSLSLKAISGYIP